MSTNNSNTMQNVKKHFDDEAEEYDSLILTLIPHYSEMIETLIFSIPFNEKDAIRVLDMGCGTGNISKKVKERFPNAKITCVDLAENMIQMAKNKLNEYSDISYKLCDFQDLELDEEYDVVISSLALHHLENDEVKIKVYKFIFKTLRVGGVFYNADVVLGSNEYLQNFYLDKWKEFLSKTYSREEIENKWFPTYYREDKPAEMRDHIKWLEDVGFKQVDVVWKYYNYAVYGGVK